MFRDCRCGNRIPADWPECADCVVTGYLRPDMTVEIARRKILARRRVLQGKKITDVLQTLRSDPEVARARQIAVIQQGRKQRAQAASRRGKQAIRDFYDGW